MTTKFLQNLLDTRKVFVITIFFLNSFREDNKGFYEGRNLKCPQKGYSESCKDKIKILVNKLLESNLIKIQAFIKEDKERTSGKEKNEGRKN